MNTDEQQVSATSFSKSRTFKISDAAAPEINHSFSDSKSSYCLPLLILPGLVVKADAIPPPHQMATEKEENLQAPTTTYDVDSSSINMRGIRRCHCL